MDRHELNPIALVVGAIFTVLGIAYLIGRWSWFDLGRGWVLGALLIALGVAGVVTVARRGPLADATPLDDPPV
jgi:hypothetical protein